MTVILVVSLVCIILNILLLNPTYDLMARNPTLDRVMLIILWFNLALDIAAKLAASL